MSLLMRACRSTAYRETYTTHKNHTMTQKCIAVLGYGEHCSIQNKARAFQAGHEIASRGLAVCVGNLSGTFHHALNGAKRSSGRTIAILESINKISDKSLCDDVLYTKDTEKKHQLIAEKSIGAIVIGGGEGTNKLIARLLSMSRMVIAIRDSGGVVNSKLDKRVIVEDDIETAINFIINNM